MEWFSFVWESHWIPANVGMTAVDNARYNDYLYNMVNGLPEAIYELMGADEAKRAESSKTPQLLAFDLLLRTAGELDQQLAQVLKPAGMTPAQFNVLRVLRNAGGAGLACGEVSERLVRHDPDVTRLLDRLEARGLVARSRDTTDRRVVIARITEEGLGILEALSASVTTLHERQFGPLSRAEFRTFVGLLEKIWNGGPEQAES
jgi:DNA-binding MarR family transcriptional regulator